MPEIMSRYLMLHFFAVDDAFTGKWLKMYLGEMCTFQNGCHNKLAAVGRKELLFVGYFMRMFLVVFKMMDIGCLFKFM